MRGNLAMNHAFAAGPRFLVRGSYWGGYFDGEQPYYESDPANTIDYPSRILFDVEAARKLADRWTLTVGAQNVLNTYPAEYPGGRSRRRQPLRPIHTLRLQRRLLLHAVELQRGRDSTRFRWAGRPR